VARGLAIGPDQAAADSLMVDVLLPEVGGFLHAIRHFCHDGSRIYRFVIGRLSRHDACVEKDRQ